MTCFCTGSYLCAQCDREIDAVEHERDYPDFDGRAADEAASRWEMSTRLGDL